VVVVKKSAVHVCDCGTGEAVYDPKSLEISRGILACIKVYLAAEVELLGDGMSPELATDFYREPVGITLRAGDGFYLKCPWINSWLKASNRLRDLVFKIA
ncbi:MAG: hypothetical protein WBV90_16840, partial [Terrimicrobiaceae bacterium]